MKVFKFGGSSIASAANISNAAAIIRKELERSELIVVVSAIARVTDLLAEAGAQAGKGDEAWRETLDVIGSLHADVIRELFGEEAAPEEAWLREVVAELNDVLHGVALLRELSDKSLVLILSYGERLSCRIMSRCLDVSGTPAECVDARELIVTDENYCYAKVDRLATGKRIKERFQTYDPVPVVTGFIASAEDGSVTNLGRGGSDFTATILGAALHAEEVWIWTHVDGFYSADPKRVPDAKVLPEISYAEAMELSHAGAKVLHPLAVQPVMKASIPLLIRNASDPENPGTRIGQLPASTDGQPRPVTGLTSINRVVLLNLSGSGMAGVPGTASRLFTCLARHSINIIFISQASSEQSISLAVAPDQASMAKKVLEEEYSREIKERRIDPVSVRRNLAMVAIVGNKMSGHPGVSAQLFETLGKNGVNVIAVAQGANEMNISVVIDSSDEDKALNCIHESFFLSMRKVHVFIAGTGTIAKSLISQIRDHRATLQQEMALDIVVAGLANTRAICIEPEGIDLEHWEESMKTREAHQGIGHYIKLIRAENLHNTIVVDCTASKQVAESYPELLQANISVATANKLGMAGSGELYGKIMKAERSSNARFLYETNVGAGLPIISTLNDLKNSGDRIICIEGVLSGTLSYIFNELRKGGRFSEIVRKAKESGYTEPDPRDDLSGADFARKMLILGRALGYQLEYDDVECQSLVPESCQGDMSTAEFLDRLATIDDWYVEEMESAAKEGKTIAYTGELKDGKAKVGLKRVPLESPVAGLNGTENLVVFTTDRYLDTPLVVKGPGAGGEVTAGGVFADILRIASYLV
ncbi:aspartate kinase [Chlorobaculum parvum NCIB 8327]|uniref:Aspartate kinase n=1 Tax=Chlorobaculum parvum (strain DSM 263 / NCIMB 8327) TaxID=517417 RepID=B3QL61_CHLP8|nr:bifunctional aspartate kinase/homoserine dehydrogenase I [Chlorobaculum parvum]ACF12299.1 aspartate kinase [Chlorobaculum parvum NCIB 8327]